MLLVAVVWQGSISRRAVNKTVDAHQWWIRVLFTVGCIFFFGFSWQEVMLLLIVQL